MTNLQTLREAVTALGLALGLGVLVGGFDLGLQALACAALACANLAAYRALTTRITSDLASGGDGGLAGLALSGKPLATLVVVAGLLAVVDAAALALGLTAALGVAVFGAASLPSIEEASA